MRFSPRDLVPPTPAPNLRKSDFANPDGRTRCPTSDCFGDLVLFPTGHVDEEGIPSFHDATNCPLCGRWFDLEADITDRDLYLKIAWFRQNPDGGLPREPRP